MDIREDGMGNTVLRGVVLGFSVFCFITLGVMVFKYGFMRSSELDHSTLIIIVMWFLAVIGGIGISSVVDSWRKK